MKYIASLDDRDLVVEIERSDQVILNGTSHHIDLQSIDGESLFSLLMDGQSYEIYVQRSEGRYYVMVGGERHVVEVEDERLARLARLGGARHEVTGDVAVKAPMPGLVVAVPVQEGAAIRSGEGLVILEAMKMENEIRSPRDGTAKSVRVRAGQAVNQGEVLVVIG